MEISSSLLRNLLFPMTAVFINNTTFLNYREEYLVRQLKKMKLKTVQNFENC
jgi:hypothetical protein